ncbi:uncharacterized protein METZ01_LOCUS478575, partial [marine metagenome]
VIKTDIVIIGAGPVGLFTVFEAGLLDLECHLIDNLDRPGGQCIELYPEKPIYDIPGVANQTAREHIEALMEQIKPFNPTFHLAQSVETLRFVKKNNKKYYIKTSAGTEFETPNVIVCSGAGSFEPKKLNIEDAEAFEGKGLEYAVRSKDQYTDKRVVVF